MKKIALFFAAVAAIYSVVSCQKETKGQNDEAQARMSFVATMPDYSPDSKTTFGDFDAVNRKMPMLWSSSDKIDVYGVTGTTTAKAIFEITSLSADKKSATFSIKEGETLGTFDNYYAIYPSGVALKQTSLSGGSLEINSGISALENGQAIVENGYDPALAIMTASFDEGKLAFRHGVCYFGIQIPEDNITQIKIDVVNTAFQKRPVYASATGAISGHNSGSKYIKSVTGTFVKGSYYYLCAIPKVFEDTKMGNLTVTYTHNGVEKAITTSATTISNAYPQIGKVYDLGCPPLPVVNPSITAENITGVNVAGVTDETHSVSFADAEGWTPSIQSYTGCVTAASLTSTDVIAANPSNNTVTYSVGAYDALVGNTGTIVVRLSKTGKDPIDKTINVTQNTSATPTPHTYELYVDGSSIVQKDENGSNTDYFTLVGSMSILTCNPEGHFGVSSFDIPSFGTVTKAMKVESTKYPKFTPRAGYTTDVIFYGAAREGTGTSLRLYDGSSNVVTISLPWADSHATLTSGSKTGLTAGTEYKFTKSGETGLFYVKVTETPISE